MSTMNMFSNAGNVMAYALYCSAGDKFADLSLGYAYSLVIANNTTADITAGSVTVEVADASDDPCVPGAWGPLDPVDGCSPIVTGQPEAGPVTIPITPERPIPARGTCAYSIPCPKQFMRVTGAPAGCDVICVITRLRRSDHSHYGPYGQIPPPATLQAPFGQQTAAAPASGAVSATHPASAPRPRAREAS